MKPSRVNYDILQKRLKKQRIKKICYLLLGLLLGLSIAASSIIWYPYVQELWNLPNLSVTTSKKQSSNKQPTPIKDSPKIANTFVPRTNFEKTNQQGIYENSEKQLAKMITESNTSGSYLVIKNNQVILHSSQGEDIDSNSKDQTYMMASIQKMITAILIMNLIEKNDLQLDTKLNTFLPEFPNSESIDINSLLQMTSGLYLNDGTMPSSFNDIVSWTTFVQQNTIYQPMNKWKYSAVNYTILAMLIEKVSGMSYADYFDKVIKQPLDLKQTDFYTHNDSHLVPSYYLENSQVAQKPVAIDESMYLKELGTGNIYTSVKDLAIIIQALVDGKLGNTQLVKQVWSPQPTNFPYTYKSGVYYDGTLNSFYGHGVFRGYESVALFNYDASNMVIFLSNIYRKDESNINLAKTLYQTINEDTEAFRTE